MRRELASKGKPTFEGEQTGALAGTATPVSWPWCPSARWVECTDIRGSFYGTR